MFSLYFRVFTQNTNHIEEILHGSKVQFRESFEHKILKATTITTTTRTTTTTTTAATTSFLLNCESYSCALNE